MRGFSVSPYPYNVGIKIEQIVFLIRSNTNGNQKNANQPNQKG